jgi:hypothetical protein
VPGWLTATSGVTVAASGSGHGMSEHHHDPSGTPPTEPRHLTDRALAPGEQETTPKAAPGTYQSTEEDRERGKAVKPGN